MGLLCTLALTSPLLAASDLVKGDGSDADNARLRPGVYPRCPL